MPWLLWITALHCAGRRHDERRRVGVWAVTEALLRDSPAGLDVKRTWSLIRIVIVGDGPPVRSFFVGPGSLPPSLPSVHASPPPLPPSAGLVARTLFGGFSSPSSIGEAYALYLGRGILY